jgi:tripartite-type tricarboxylate transporter receptor subunit TctC
LISRRPQRIISDLYSPIDEEGNMTTRILTLLGIFGLLVGLLGGNAMCAEWPAKPLTAIVPWATGGMTDITTRLLVERFKEKLGQPVAVSNMGGAGGITGMRAILSARPDGYTLGSGATSSALGSTYFLDNPPFDLSKIDYIGSYCVQERILFAPPDKPYRTLKEFIDYVRKNPGAVSVGAGGAQWSMEVMKSLAKKEGLKLKFVMFKTGGEASTAILGGHVDLVETGSGTPAYQAAREGKLIPLVDLGSSRDPHFPNLKNMEELGYPFSCSSDYGMWVPAGVPEAIRAKLENALKQTIAEPSVKESLAQMGLNAQFVPGKEYREIVVKVVQSIPKLAEYVKDVE